MSGKKRLVLGLTSLPVLIASAGLLRLLPAPDACLSFDCGPYFDSGAVDVFGMGTFTLAQTLVLAAGIWVAALLLAGSVLPTMVLTRAGVATAVLALAIAWLLPARVVGPEPSVVCSSPDARGRPVEGRCATGPAPMDNRVGDRVLVAASGLAALGLAAIGDHARRRTTEGWRP